jgi:CRP/FNR family transcriptional regulator
MLCKSCGGRVNGFFCTLADSQRKRVERTKSVERYRRGEVVFREGEPASAVYCIRTGAVKLYKLGSEGDEVVIRLLGPGDIMGYRPVLANDTFAATARALEDATVCRVARDVLLATLRESPELAMSLLGKLAHELRESEDQMVRRVVETVPQRTARFLIWLAESSAGMNDPVRFETVLRREDMATVIGTTPETLSRILRDLERRQILGLSRRSIEIREPEKLELLALEGKLE